MRKKSSLRRNIILATALAVSILAAAMVLIMISVMNYLSNTILLETLRPTAKTAAMAIQGNLNMMSDRIFLIRDNGVFKDPNAGKEEKQLVLDIAESGIEFVWLGLYSSTGRLETGTRTSPQLLDYDFTAVMEETKNLVINDTYAAIDRDPEIIMGTPVFSGEKLINFLAGSYKYDILNDVLENINISLNSTAYIFNEKGKYMAHRNIGKVRSGDYVFADYSGKPEYAGLVEKMMDGQTGSVHLGRGKTERFFSFAPVRGTRWTVVIEVPRKDLMAAIEGGLYISVCTTLVLLGIFLILVNFFMARFLTHPLKLITENTYRINRGILKLRFPPALVERHDEIGQLAVSFVSMSRSIEGVTKEIEQIARAASSGRLNQRADLSLMQGDFLKIGARVNGALDLFCSYLNAIPVAVALFNEKKEMLYRNHAMNEFMVMHDLDGCEDSFLEQIAGGGSMSSEDTLDPRAAAIFNPTLINPEPFVTDIAILGHDGGSNYTLTIQRTGLIAHDKDSVCVILLLSDVTMLTRAKIDAEAASRTKSDFLSKMSHEIRTPMNAVIGMTQIAKKTKDLDKIRNCLDQVENSSNHLLGVINDILDFSKIESGKLMLDLTEFSLTEDLNFVISMMISRAKERNIELCLTAENIQNDCIYSDSLRLNQVLINLLSNAIKFSPQGSEVFLNVRELGSEDGSSSYRFEVVDRGIGISEFQASKLFRPFEQADGTITRNYGGTGLGLAISKNLVEMLGGKIALTSKEGEGSVFSFTIHCRSRIQLEKKTENQDELYDTNSFDFSGKRCLVVDDIDINRDIIIELLSGTNLALETAGNGKEAVEKFQSSGEGYYDIILMDMQMPVMDGCSATREIRRIEKELTGKNPEDYREIRVVAMTANVMQEDIQKALDSGMNAHLSKPIQLETTLKTIREQLNLS